MNLLRYPQEVVDVDDYNLPSAKSSGVRISKADLDMAEKLIESTSSKWQPEDYRDEFRERLSDVIRKRMKAKGVIKTIEDESAMPGDASTNVVDFMALLRESLDSNKRTPAKPKSATSRKETTKSASAKAGKSASGGKPKKTSKRKIGQYPQERLNREPGTPWTSVSCACQRRKRTCSMPHNGCLLSVFRCYSYRRETCGSSRTYQRHGSPVAREMPTREVATGCAGGGVPSSTMVKSPIPATMSTPS